MKLLFCLLAAPVAEWLGRFIPPFAKFARRCRMKVLHETNILEWRRQTALDAGVKLGRNVKLYSFYVWSEPPLLEIGDNTIVSGEVFFVTHDGGVYTDPMRRPELVGSYGRISIGADCFIGMRATILPDVQLGDRCIVAAGSVVSESFPSDSVIMGSPAKRVMSTSTYYMFRRNSPNTLYDAEYSFDRIWPEIAPPGWVAGKIGHLPIRAPRPAAPPSRANDGT